MNNTWWVEHQGVLLAGDNIYSLLVITYIACYYNLLLGGCYVYSGTAITLQVVKSDYI